MAEFSIEIPDDSVDLVITALSVNSGYTEATPDAAKQNVINYIKNQVVMYKQLLASQQVENIDIK